MTSKDGLRAQVRFLQSKVEMLTSERDLLRAQLQDATRGPNWVELSRRYTGPTPVSRLVDVESFRGTESQMLLLYGFTTIEYQEAGYEGPTPEARRKFVHIPGKQVD